MISVMDMFLIILYILLIVLVIVAIIVLFKMLKTIGKVDKVVDDVDAKVNKLNGTFELIDTATDAIASFSDLIVDTIVGGLRKTFKKKEGKKDE